MCAVPRPQITLKLENTKYNRANLCCGQDEDSSACRAAEDQAIKMGAIASTQTDKVHLVISNLTQYYPAYPQISQGGHQHVGSAKLDPDREGWMGNGKKINNAESADLVQINLCKGRMMTVQACFVNDKRQPIKMRTARLRIFDLDMGSKEAQNGPEAVQFKCPGGTFQVFGKPPYMSYTVGQPISVEEGATPAGQTKYTYKCPDDDYVTMWSSREGTLADSPTSTDYSEWALEDKKKMEDSMILVSYQDVSCVNITMANMPPMYRQESWEEGGMSSTGWDTEFDASAGGNPLNTTLPLTYKNFAQVVKDGQTFDGLQKGHCPWNGVGRNWLFAGYTDRKEPLDCPLPSAEALRADKAAAARYAENVVEQGPGVAGGFGGECTCPDGTTYLVGDDNQAPGCVQLSCVGGVAGTCKKAYGAWSNRKVTCGGLLAQEKVAPEKAEQAQESAQESAQREWHPASTQEEINAEESAEEMSAKAAEEAGEKKWQQAKKGKTAGVAGEKRRHRTHKETEAEARTAAARAAAADWHPASTPQEIKAEQRRLAKEVEENIEEERARRSQRRSAEEDRSQEDRSQDVQSQGRQQHPSSSKQESKAEERRLAKEQKSKRVVVHGDPMFKKHGVGLQFSIPLGKPTELLSWANKDGEQFILSGTTFERESTGHQWFNSFAMTVDGREVFNASTLKVVRGTMRVLVDGRIIDPSEFSTANTEYAGIALNLTSAVHKGTSFKLSMLEGKKFLIGHKKAQTLKVNTGDVTFSVYSSKAAKFAFKDNQFKFRHLNVRLDSGIPKGAQGIFAEMAGTVPMSTATRELLHKPKQYDRLQRLEKKRATRPGRARRGGRKAKKRRITSLWEGPAPEID